ncbi:MAG: Ni/Fe hydrogenase subunit alpha, partial [Gemmatimonadetes bacterium]|nr:Ni/Fe hydrogenase subunit alpha [Gemmatimonadota bacterium]
KLGNALVASLGGRAVHPVGVCVGGFYSALDPGDAARLLPEVRACLDDMCELTLFLAEKLDYPDLERDYEFLALCPDDQYPMNLGRIRSNKGLDVENGEFLSAIEERHVKHSNALHASIKGRGSYVVGPLARLNLNAEKLHPRAAELLPRVCDLLGRSLPWKNNFLSLPARALETVHALAVAADLLDGYEPPARSRIPLRARAGLGSHGTEAPRGICWHQYRTGEDGSIQDAMIIPPTSQNQASIEEDLRVLANRLAETPDEEAALRCEQLIRNYDPCISCSVHFLQFERIRR